MRNILKKNIKFFNCKRFCKDLFELVSRITPIEEDDFTGNNMWIMALLDIELFYYSKDPYGLNLQSLPINSKLRSRIELFFLYNYDDYNRLYMSGDRVVSRNTIMSHSDYIFKYEMIDLAKTFGLNQVQKILTSKSLYSKN